MTAGSGTHSPAAGAVFLLRFQRDALQRPEPGRVQNLSPHISTECVALANPFFLAVERAKCSASNSAWNHGRPPDAAFTPLLHLSHRRGVRDRGRARTRAGHGASDGASAAGATADAAT